MASENKTRQEMIEMMYLVLTALLALNVSKNILEAFVAIEENLQISNENEFARGNEKLLDVRQVALDKTDPAKQAKAQEMLKVIEKVDKLVGKDIKFVDDLKIDILKAVGEDLNNPEEPIITKKYDPKNPTLPTRFNLANVAAKDNFDDPMHVMGIGEDLNRPTGNGKKLWETMQNFRSDLVKLFVESAPKPEGASAYHFNDPKIVKFKDMKDLKKQIDAAIKKSNVPKDEVDHISDLYMKLTKNQIVENIDHQKLHWIGKTFDHSPVVAAISALTSIENEFLSARADVISWIRSRVGGGEYSFNKVMSLAYGPDLVNSGDEFELQVLMAAFDSDRQPKVTVNGNPVTDVHDGVGHIKMKAGASDMNLKGTVTIAKNDGSTKTLDWEKNVKVMKPSASLTLPELMVLYKGYDNKVRGVASGYDQTILSASGGVSLIKSGDGYIARVGAGAGKTATITVSGRSSVTNKTASLGTFSFDIKNLPAPALFIDNKPGGANISKNSSFISAGYGPEIPLKVKFTLISWELGVEGINRRSTGSGSHLSARAVLNQGRKGGKVFVDAKVRYPSGVIGTITGVYNLQ